MFFKKKNRLDELVKKIENKHLFTRYINLIIGCALLALSFDIFFEPRNIVYGGVSGVAIVVRNIFGMDTSLFVLISS